MHSFIEFVVVGNLTEFLVGIQREPVYYVDYTSGCDCETDFFVFGFISLLCDSVQITYSVSLIIL